MIKKVISIILVFVLLYIMAIPSIAATQSELQELREQKSEAENEKKEVTAEKNSVLDDISELNAQISKYEDEIDELNSKIDDLEDSISEKEKEIKKLEEENKEREDLLVNRLIAMYEKGQVTYLDVLLSSDNITTFISNYYRVEEITQADQEVIDSILEKQEETQKAKNELQKEQNKVDEAKKEVETKSDKLEVIRKTKQAKVNTLSGKEKELQKTIDEFNDAIEEAQAEIAAAVNQSQSSGGGYTGSFKGMFEWPISYSYNIITSVFGYRDAPTAGASSNHGAIDIAVRYVPVYAPADGKVIIARALSGYGNYIMIDHGNGYYTGFGHLSGYNVSAGEIVSTGDRIATSGNTGISTGPHLHYEVYIGGTANSYRVDPLQYTSHPSLVYY